MDITQVNQGLWIRKLDLFQEVFDSDWVIGLRLVLDNSLDDSELVALGGSLDVLEYDVFIFNLVDQFGQEHVDAIIAANTLEHLDTTVQL